MLIYFLPFISRYLIEAIFLSYGIFYLNLYVTAGSFSYFEYFLFCGLIVALFALDNL